MENAGGIGTYIANGAIVLFWIFVALAVLRALMIPVSLVLGVFMKSDPPPTDKEDSSENP